MAAEKNVLKLSNGDVVTFCVELKGRHDRKLSQMLYRDIEIGQTAKRTQGINLAKYMEELISIMPTFVESTVDSSGKPIEFTEAYYDDLLVVDTRLLSKYMDEVIVSSFNAEPDTKKKAKGKNQSSDNVT